MLQVIHFYAQFSRLGVFVQNETTPTTIRSFGPLSRKVIAGSQGNTLGGALINDVITFDTACIRGNFYGTLSGPMDTYRVPQIRISGLENGNMPRLRKFAQFPKRIRTP